MMSVSIDRLTEQLIQSQANFHYGYCRMGIEDALTMTESPIEALLLADITIAAISAQGPLSKHELPILQVSTDQNTRPSLGLSGIILIPQFLWQGYRIDFAIFWGDNRQQPIFIECDGHDFHERTKEQAARDRQKDRAIQAANIPILRFTGSEIYRDVGRCTLEILKFLNSKIRATEGPET